MERDAFVRLGTVVGDRFEIMSVAGEGGMGVVFRARDREGGGDVALKVALGVSSSTEGAARFEREISVLSELSHERIVRYVAHGATPAGHAWLAMEWLEGEDLEARLRRGPRLTVDESVAVAGAVASALGAAHAGGVLHRDVKPSNVFLVGGAVEAAKLLDFGVARDARAPARTKTGAIIGTVAYMAPEQARGDRSVDERVDVFALGCVLYECLAGRPAFDGEHAVAVLAKILMTDPPPLEDVVPGLPLALCRLVTAMLEKSRDARPRECREVLVALRACLDAPSGQGMATERLTTAETRVVTVLLVRGPEPTELAQAATEIARPSATMSDLEELAATHRARMERLHDGSQLVVFARESGSADPALRAAAFALMARAERPGTLFAIVTGSQDTRGGQPLGAAIDRLGALAGGASSGIWVDSTTAELVRPRYELRDVASGGEVLGVRPTLDPTRRVLGKATPFVGRDRELRLLGEVVDDALSEREARAAVVIAPAGVGKSRLATEVVRSARERYPELVVWRTHADSVQAGSPFGLLAGMLRHAIGVGEATPPHETRRRLGARAAELFAKEEALAVGELLAELVGAPVPEPESPRVQKARRDPQVLGDQMRRAWEEFATAACGKAPLLVVVDDLHWGDLPSVRALDATLLSCRGLPLAVLAFARPEVQETFPDIWAKRSAQLVRLAELGRKPAEALVRSVLGEDIDPATIARLVEASQGNAFFLEELVRAVGEGRAATLPDSVLAIVQSRLEALDATERRVLRAASIFGERFALEGVAHLIGEDASRAGERLVALSGKEILTSEGDRDSGSEGSRRFAFRHALLRDGAYSMLTPDDRVRGHRLAAAWLEQGGACDALALADHFALGELPARAAHHFYRASRAASRGADHVASLACLGRGLDLAEDEQQRGDFLAAAAEAHHFRGEFVLQGRAAAGAIRTATRGDLRWMRSAWSILISALHAGDPGAMAGVLDELRLLTEDPPPQLGRLAPVVLPPLALIGERTLTDRMLALARAERHEGQGPWLEWGCAYHEMLLANEPWRAAERLSALGRHFEDTGDRIRLVQTRVERALALNALGASDEASALAELVADEGDRRELALSGAFARLYIAAGLRRQGRFREAIDATRIGQARLPDSRACAALLGAERARTELALGDVEGADQTSRDTVGGGACTPDWHAAALSARADVLRAARRFGEAVEVGAIGWRLVEEGRVGVSQHIIGVAYAEALLCAGHRDRAREVVRTATARIRAYAERITDERYRRSYLWDEQANARLLALDREWSD